MSLPWEKESRTAAEHLGWLVVDTSGESDWQGTGYHLLTRDNCSRWATMSWNWGTCEVCDGLMGEPLDTPEQCAEAFGDGINEHPTQEVAERTFRECSEERV